MFLRSFLFGRLVVGVDCGIYCVTVAGWSVAGCVGDGSLLIVPSRTSSFQRPALNRCVVPAWSGKEKPKWDRSLKSFGRTKRRSEEEWIYCYALLLISLFFRIMAS